VRKKLTNQGFENSCHWNCKDYPPDSENFSKCQNCPYDNRWVQPGTPSHKAWCQKQTIQRLNTKDTNPQADQRGHATVMHQNRYRSQQQCGNGIKVGHETTQPCSNTENHPAINRQRRHQCHIKAAVHGN